MRSRFVLNGTIIVFIASAYAFQALTDRPLSLAATTRSPAVAPTYSPDAVPPSITLPVPRYKLTPTDPPEGFVSSVYGAVWAGSSPLTQYGSSPQFLGAFVKGRMVAYVDRDTGDAEVYSDLLKPPPTRPVDTVASLAIAAKFFADPNIIPKDVSRYALSATTLDENAGKTTTRILTYVSLRRTINLFPFGRAPVFGPGSQALLAIDGNGKVQGFLRRWRKASAPQFSLVRMTPDDIKANINSQLSALEAQSTSINVDRIGVGFYDGGGSYLQPVVYFFATIRYVKPQMSGPADEHVVGYVPIGTPVEQIPLVTPSHMYRVALDPGANPDADKRLPDPRVAEYLAQNVSGAFKTSARDFWDGLNASKNPTKFSGGKDPIDAVSSYYLSAKDANVNTANIVETEGHGTWWQFWASGDQSDPVQVENIPGSGYGGSTTGVAYWIIHSCEVVPSPDDMKLRGDPGGNAFTPWSNVFRGLREVLGYRTPIDVADGVTKQFGKDMGNDGIALSSWFNQIGASNKYAALPGCGSMGSGRDVTCGRASAIVVAGHQDDAMLTEPYPIGTPQPKRLVSYWMVDPR